MRTFKKRLATTLALMGLCLGGLATAGVSVGLASKPNPEHQVTICHATHSASNPYVTITVDVASIGDAQTLRGHLQHDADVIPPYTYSGPDGSFSFGGQGDQSILANGCEVGETTVTDPTTSTESTTTEQTTTTESTTTTECNQAHPCSDGDCLETHASDDCTTVPETTTTTPTGPCPDGGPHNAGHDGEPGNDDCKRETTTTVVTTTTPVTSTTATVGTTTTTTTGTTTTSTPPQSGVAGKSKTKRPKTAAVKAAVLAFTP